MSCDEARAYIEDTLPLPALAEAHLGACASCAALRASYARLDALLTSEPAPPAPLDLAPRVLALVAGARARDRAWARRQVAVLVAAALALVAGLGWALGGWGPPDPAGALVAARDLVDLALGGAGDAWLGVVSVLERGAGAVGVPSPPFLLLLALAPALGLLDRWLCRSSA